MKTLCETILTSTHFLDAKIRRVGRDQIANVSFVYPTCGTRRDFEWTNRIPCHVPPEGTKCGAVVEIPEKCDTCGGKVHSYPVEGGCPVCGAPNCCPACCAADQLENEKR